MSVNPFASSAARIARHAAVHHVARRNDVGAGACVRDGLAREQLQRRVVVDVTVTSPSRITPQWPWSVYSHRQTSVMTTRLGSSAFSARTACCTGASSFHASEPVASLRSGMPNSNTPPTPSSAASRGVVKQLVDGRLMDAGHRRRSAAVHRVRTERTAGESAATDEATSRERGFAGRRCGEVAADDMRGTTACAES